MLGKRTGWVRLASLGAELPTGSEGRIGQGSRAAEWPAARYR